MKTNYKGYEIEVVREECMAGYDLVYYSVYRISDGLEVIADFTETADTVPFLIKCMKDRVDEFIETEGDSEMLKDLY
jgi:hypothetical protein